MTILTPLEMIQGALRLIGAQASGESLDANEQADALKALNGMLDSWNLDGFTIPATTRTTTTLAASTASYTIGSGATINATQPIRIDRAGLIQSGQTYEYPIKIATTQEWENFYDKGGANPAIPYAIYFQKSTGTNGTIYPLPVPDAAHTLVLYLGTQLAQIASADIGNSYAVAPGYARAIRYNLAVELAPEYGVSATPEIVATAVESLAKVKRANDEPVRFSADSALMNGGCMWSDPRAIYRGDC